MKSNVLTLFLVVSLACVLCGCKEEHAETKPFVAKIKINEADCFRCYGGTHFLRELSEVANIELVFRGLEKNEKQRFLEINGFGNNDETLKFTAVSESSLYNSLDKYGMTELHLFDTEGKELCSFPLNSKTIARKIAEIIACGRDMMQENSPRLDLQYNSGVHELTVGNAYYLVTNRTMNCCELFDKKGRSLFQIDALQIDPLEIFPEMKRHEKYTNYLKGAGMFACRIENARMIGDEAWLKVLVPYIDVRNDSVIQEVKTCQVSYSKNTESWSQQVVYNSKEKPLETIGNARDGGNYYGVSLSFLETGAFEYDCFSMTNVDKALRIDEIKKIDVPDFGRIPHFAYEAKIKDGLLAFGFTDFLYDLEHDTVYWLPINCNPQMTGMGTTSFNVTTDGHVVDWAFDGESLAVVYYDAKQRQCQYLFKDNLTEETTVTPLLFGEELKCPALCLISPNVLYYLDSENRVQVTLMPF